MTATKVPLTKETVDDLIPRKVGEIKRDRKFNMLIYGEPGAGKTHLSGSADEVPQCREVLHLDIGGGSMTLDPYYPNVETIILDRWEQLETIYKKLFFGKDDFDRFNTVVIDHITEVQKLCQRWTMAGAKERAQKRGDDPELLEEDVPQQKHYLIMYERIMQMLRDYRDLDINFICTAHVMEDTHPNTGARRLKPSLSGKAKSDIPGLFDIVAYLHTERVNNKDVRLFSTGNNSGYVAKARGFIDLPANIQDATIADILSYTTEETEGVKP